MLSMGSHERLNPSRESTEHQYLSPGDDVPTNETDKERIPSLKLRSSAIWYPGARPTVHGASKAAPVTEVARESVSVAKSLALNISSPSIASLKTPKPDRNPALQLTKKGAISTRSLPADATTTRVNIGSEGSISAPIVYTPPEPTYPNVQQLKEDQAGDKDSNTLDGAANEPSNTTAETNSLNAVPESTENSNTISPPTETIGWLSWMYGWYTWDRASPGDLVPVNVSTEQTQVQSYTDRPDQPDQIAQEAEESDQREEERNKSTETTEVRLTSQTRSWVQMWHGASPFKAEKDLKRELPISAHEPASYIARPHATPGDGTESSGEVGVDAESTAGNAKPSGWSFWLKDGSKTSASSKAGCNKPSDAIQDRGTLPEQLRPDPEPEAEHRINTIKTGAKQSKGSAKEELIAHGVEPNTAPLPPKTSETTASRQLQTALQNEVLPRFTNTFALEETPSWWQTIGRLWHSKKEQGRKHVYMIKEPPQIKRALAIGIHGYFPAPLIRSVLGQPTGTSVRFSNMAASAIRRWTADHGYQCEIEKLALEGEGRIAERVSLLWKLLLNAMDDIRKADFIMIACHSQGVPVAIMLVAKLITFGCMNAARVGICAMASVNMGPFSDYKSRWISGSAGELFEFALPDSQVSKDYEAALRSALDFGVRISYIGSIDDQLVSLESSIFSPISHPYIYRAVFVDGRVHAPGFLSHLVGFTLKLRNLGISDHGIIRELSAPLAGSLYTGDGHSRLYDDESVYYLAIEFALQTSNVSDATLQVRRPPPSPANPFILPFAMRGLLEEEYVRRELYEETMELLRQFDDWRPSSKVLKDVKFRLEGVRSKL